MGAITHLACREMGHLYWTTFFIQESLDFQISDFAGSGVDEYDGFFHGECAVRGLKELKSYSHFSFDLSQMWKSPSTTECNIVDIKHISCSNIFL